MNIDDKFQKNDLLHKNQMVKNKYLSFSSICCFILPLLTIPRIEFGGQVLLSDFICLILLVLTFFSGNFNFKQKYMWKIIFFISLWFFGAILSDIINGSSTEDLLKGWSKIFLFGVYLITFFVLINGYYERYISALTGIAFTYILNWIFQVNEVLLGPFWGQAWKFGVGYGFSILFLLILTYKIKNIKILALIILLISPLHLFLAARSLFLTVFLSGFLLLTKIKVRHKATRIKLMVFYILLAFLSFPIMNFGYDFIVKTGVFGQDVLEKHLMQTSGSKNIILDGRSESLISIRAIKDSPIIGHGSWAKSDEYYIEYNKLLEMEGRDVNWGSVLSKGKTWIPTHSHIFGAWVENGILGGVFWLLILFIMFRALNEIIFGISPSRPIEILAIVWTIWNIIFSPFGADQRCFEAIYIVIAVTILLRAKKNSSNNLVDF